MGLYPNIMDIFIFYLIGFVLLKITLEANAPRRKFILDKMNFARKRINLATFFYLSLPKNKDGVFFR